MLRATGSGHCRRCDAHVRTVEPWPHWRRARLAFLGTLGLLGVASPILSADYCVMIPSLMLFLGAIGPLNGYVEEKPTCATCGAVVGG